MSFLSPEKNKYMLRAYHSSGKSIIPLMFMSWVTNHYDLSIQTPIHIVNAANMGYHSYVSTSCILTDYVKTPNVARIARISSAGFHGLATIGLLYASINHTQPNFLVRKENEERNDIHPNK